MNKVAPWAAVAVVALATAGRSEAMQLPLTRAQLCALSATVVVARVAEVETHWAAGAEGGIERHALLDVERVVKGPTVAGATVLLPGGELENLRHWVEDVPELESDARYVLFLGKLGSAYEVLGGEAGAVQVASETDWRGEAVDAVIASMEGCDAR